MVRTVDLINRFPPQKKGRSFTKMEELSIPSQENRVKLAKELYEGAKQNLYKIFRLIRMERGFSIDAMFPYVNSFVSRLQAEDDPLVQLVYQERREDDVLMHLAVHSLNTAIVAIKIGIGLKFGSNKLKNLALLAFFHDVGMVMLPPELTQKTGSLTPTELMILKKHPEYGSRIMRQAGTAYGTLANEIYQEHERSDGSGYPRGLKGKEISENASIIGISDLYTSLLSPRYHRGRYLPFEAVKEIIATSKEQFPRKIMRGLINEFSIFPRSIYVRLNSQEVGRVIATNRLSPLRPVVEVLYDVNGQRMQHPKIVDMVKDNILQITSACFDEDELNLR